MDLSPIDVTVFLGARTGTQSTESSSSQDAPGLSQRTGNAEAAAVVLVALSRDKEVISAECRARFTVKLEDATKVAGLLKGREALSVWDLGATVREQLIGPVLLPLIAQHDAGEFRGSSGIRSQIEQEARTRMAPSFAALGLGLDGFTIAWGVTEAEAQQVARNRAEREEAAVTFAHQRGLAELMRAQEVQRVRLVNLQELRMAETKGDEELKNLLLAGGIHRDRSWVMPAPDTASGIRWNDLLSIPSAGRMTVW